MQPGDFVQCTGRKTEEGRLLGTPRVGAVLIVLKVIPQDPYPPAALTEDRKGRKHLLLQSDLIPLPGRRPKWMLERLATKEAV